MTDHDPHSPWSRETLGAPPAEPTPVLHPAPPQSAHGQPAPTQTSHVQPSHAWLSAETYATGSPPPAAYAPLPPATPPPVEVHVTAPSGGRGLAVLGVVLGGLALLGMLGVLMFVGFLGFFDDGSGGGGGGYGSLRGKIAPSGGALSGSALADEVTRQLTDQGDEPEGITCPQTVKVMQDVTTVCHGTDYGDEVTLIVFFEDDEGAYTLLEL